MIDSYMTSQEMAQFERALDRVLDDTLSCWQATRINGRSASLSCDGNISIPLLKAFDKVRKLEQDSQQATDAEEA